MEVEDGSDDFRDRDPAFLFRDPTVYRNLVLDTIKMKVSNEIA